MSKIVFFKCDDDSSITLDDVTFKHVDNKQEYVAHFDSDTKIPNYFESRIPGPAKDNQEFAHARAFTSTVWRCEGVINYTSDRPALARETCLKIANEVDKETFAPVAYVNNILTEKNIWMSIGCHGSHLIQYKDKVLQLTYNRMFCHQRNIDQDRLTGHQHITVDDHIFDLECF